MAASRIRDNVERWLVHRGLAFEDRKNPENVFQITVKHVGSARVPMEIFEPKAQQGILVVGSKVIMKNSQNARYLGYTTKEKERFERRVADYCHSIQAINRNTTEDGKRKIGVYVVLDKEGSVSQQGLFDAMDKVSEMHEKTVRFLMKTF